MKFFIFLIFLYKSTNVTHGLDRLNQRSINLRHYIEEISNKIDILKDQMQDQKELALNFLNKAIQQQQNLVMLKKKQVIQTKINQELENLEIEKLKKLTANLKNFIQNKRIFLRTDFNVPIKEKRIQNDFRIKSSLKTINYILDQNPKILILASHLGRPNGEYEEKYTMRPVYNYLKEIYQDLFFNEKYENIDQKIQILENLRFYKEETGSYKKNDQKIKCEKSDISKFRQKLSSLSDIYVDDAFGCMHRAHSSIVGIENQYKGFGFLVEKELEYFGKVFDSDEKITVVLGGAKVSDKIDLIKNLSKRASKIIIGGAMSFPFLKYQGFELGSSKQDNIEDKHIKEIIEELEKNKCQLFLPRDLVCLSEDDQVFQRKVQEGLSQKDKALDIGEETIQQFSQLLDEKQLIVMNGPMGLFEDNRFQNGSQKIAQKIASNPGTSIICGGDTVSMIDEFSLREKISHVSTGGGSSLEFLSGKELPGVKFLMNQFIYYLNKLFDS